MKSNSRRTRASAASPQTAPLRIADDAQRLRVVLKVDQAEQRGRTVLVSGWMAGSADVELLRDGAPVPATLTRSRRPDVAATLKLAEGPEGFGLTLAARGGPGNWSLRVTFDVDGIAHQQVHALKMEAVPQLSTPETIRLAVGSIEAAAASLDLGEAVVAGWELHHARADVWLEDERGRRYPIEGYRFFRADVMAAHEGDYGMTGAPAGFIVRLRGVAPGERLRLLALCDDELLQLGETTCAMLPADPALASRWLFGLNSPEGDFSRRLPLVDAPLLEALMRSRQQQWDGLPLEEKSIGDPAPKPLVSVIVPLFGRADFVEDQLIEFSRDAWFRNNAELIYVLDDPRLVEAFTARASILHRLYEMPMRWLWGGTNRGFSGANNLGANAARAKLLLFMNSDVFPQEAGWLPEMIKVLQQRPELAAVAPRLLHADGSIQHAGMAFERREDLGVWINHHPLLGADPALDPHQEPTVVGAVTGACILVRATELRAVGGWDCDYLIGDFEDSDLCLKLLSRGYQVAYVPGVQLTHLERQSFQLLGSGGYRSRVTLYNATRHQNRWQHMLGAIA